MSYAINRCTLNRAIRAITGIVLLYIGFVDSILEIENNIRIPLGLFGLMNIISAYMGLRADQKNADLRDYENHS